MDLYSQVYLKLHLHSFVSPLCCEIKKVAYALWNRASIILGGGGECNKYTYLLQNKCRNCIWGCTTIVSIVPLYIDISFLKTKMRLYCKHSFVTCLFNLNVLTFYCWNKCCYVTVMCISYLSSLLFLYVASSFPYWNLYSHNTPCFVFQLFV